jgi:hypothetical protein
MLITSKVLSYNSDELKGGMTISREKCCHPPETLLVVVPDEALTALVVVTVEVVLTLAVVRPALEVEPVKLVPLCRGLAHAKTRTVPDMIKAVNAMAQSRISSGFNDG